MLARLSRWRTEFPFFRQPLPSLRAEHLAVLHLLIVEAARGNPLEVDGSARRPLQQEVGWQEVGWQEEGWHAQEVDWQEVAGWQEADTVLPFLLSLSRSLSLVLVLVAFERFD